MTKEEIPLNTRRSFPLSRSSRSCLGGVCGGLARYFNISADVMRLTWLAAIFLGGLPVGFYLILWWLMPHELRMPVEPSIWQPKGERLQAPFERTRHDRVFLGVCGGLARFWGVEATWLRLALVVVTLLSVGAAVVLYIAAAWWIPSSCTTSHTSHPVGL
jgi:phage shock protein C